MVAISAGTLFFLLPALLLCSLPLPALCATCDAALTPAQCTVLYGSLLQINCPDKEATNIEWYVQRNDHTDIIKSCSKKSECTILNVQWPDSGLYTCSIALNKTASLNYTTTVTVQAPPYLRDQEQCDYQTHSNCSQIPNNFYRGDSNLPVGVVFEGVGEFNVSWTHNGSPLHCTVHTCVRRDTNRSSTIILSGIPGTDGVYVANVSNAIGWNSSTISVKYMCRDGSLPTSDYVQYTHVKSGHTATVTCPGDVPNDSVIRMCYVQGHSNNIVNQSRDCVECLAFRRNNHTKCGDIPGRRDWTVTRTETPTTDSCRTQAESVLTIPKFKSEDAGMVFCYASQNKYLGSRFYAVELISDKQSHVNVKIIVAVTLGVVTVVFVSLVLVLVAKRYWRRKSKHSNGGPTVESGEQERSEVDSDVREREELTTERTVLIIHDDQPPTRDRVVRRPPRHSTRPIAVRRHSTDYGSFSSESCSSIDSRAMETEAPPESCSDLDLPPEVGTIIVNV